MASQGDVRPMEPLFECNSNSLRGDDVAKMNPKAELLSSRAITMLFTTLRSKSTTQRDYVNAADRLMSILAEEGLLGLVGASEEGVGVCVGVGVGVGVVVGVGVGV